MSRIAKAHQNDSSRVYVHPVNLQGSLKLLLRQPRAGNRAREEFAFRQGAKTQRSLVECKFEQRSMNVNFSNEFSTVGCRSNIKLCWNGEK